MGFKITINIGSTSSDLSVIKLTEKLLSRILKTKYQNYIYISNNSNHPPSVGNQLPKTIENRLLNISITINGNFFNTIKRIFRTALNNANYNYTLQYKLTPVNNKQNRRRKCYYDSPPILPICQDQNWYQIYRTHK